MSATKPLPKQRKRTCYNYKCRYLKQWVFDERGKLEERGVEARGETMNRSFHEGALTQEVQESRFNPSVRRIPRVGNSNPLHILA